MSELTIEQRILIAMRKTLGAVIRDVTPPAGMRHPFSPETTEDVRQCLALISARERELAEAHGVQLILLHIPTMWNALKPSIQAARWPKTPDRCPLLDLLRAIDPSTIDALPALRQAASEDNRGLYLPNDEHLGTRGHAVVARLIVDELRRLGLSAAAPPGSL